MCVCVLEKLSHCNPLLGRSNDPKHPDAITALVMHCFQYFLNYEEIRVFKVQLISGCGASPCSSISEMCMFFFLSYKDVRHDVAVQMLHGRKPWSQRQAETKKRLHADISDVSWGVFTHHVRWKTLPGARFSLFNRPNVSLTLPKRITAR